ncbi:MAG: hypothetical protein P8X55_14820 [Desulfosarcinaceae bacterium]|jgi:hypothetical protein
MSSPYTNDLETDTALECLGDFDKTRTVCRKHCVLRLKCVIEQDHNLRMEMFEEWVAAQDEALKIQ